MIIKRIGAFTVDYIFILLIVSIFIVLDFTIQPLLVFDYFWLIVFTAAALISIKDLIFKNASIGKRLLHLKIVTEKNEIPKVYQLIIRNVTLFIWPIDVVVLIIAKKRIGEIITKTRVIDIDN